MSRIGKWLKGMSREERIAAGYCICYWDQHGNVSPDSDCPEYAKHFTDEGYTLWACRENGDTFWFRSTPPAICRKCGSAKGWKRAPRSAK